MLLTLLGGSVLWASGQRVSGAASGAIQSAPSQRIGPVPSASLGKVSATPGAGSGESIGQVPAGYVPVGDVGFAEAGVGQAAPERRTEQQGISGSGEYVWQPGLSPSGNRETSAGDFVGTLPLPEISWPSAPAESPAFGISLSAEEPPASDRGSKAAEPEHVTDPAAIESPFTHRIGPSSGSGLSAPEGLGPH